MPPAWPDGTQPGDPVRDRNGTQTKVPLRDLRFPHSQRRLPPPGLFSGSRAPRGSSSYTRCAAAITA